MNRLLGVRREDGRTVAVAFVTLATIVASHAVLETARDALFLAHLSPQRLPWAYLGIATFAFVLARAMARVGGRAPRVVLAAALAAGAVGTGAFAWIVAEPTPAALVALYVWTGVLASVVVAQFWVELGGRVDVGQAKRAYAVIAAGGMLGATLGSLLAGGILTFAGPRALLPAAALMFLGTACVPAFTGAATREAAPAPATPPEEPHDLAAVWADPYLKRLLLLAVIGPVVTMSVDYVFKSIVSQEVAKDELGPFFARYHAVVNAAALAVQVTIAPRLLQQLGVVRILCLLPGALGLVAAGVAGTAAFPAAIALRGTDGTLRHSLHRAATEILFLPLSAATRSALRGLAESLGQRGGQVLGSVAILVAIGAGAQPSHLAAGIAVLCAVWLLGYLRLQDHYVERFRTQLRSLGGTAEAVVPTLDLRSVETLVTSLSAPHDGDVIAAIDLLETYGRARLVPPLVFYHPSPAVVLRALALFDGVGREDVRELRRRLLDRPEPEVRAAALRRVVADAWDPALVRRVLREDPSPLVRHTALVLWAGRDDAAASDLDEAVAELLAARDPASRLTLASTVGELPERLVERVAESLLDGATADVRREVARSLAAAPRLARLGLLTRLVAFPDCRAAARAGLRALGEPALEHLARTLADRATPSAVRRHLPRTISRVASPRAADVLVAQLGQETDGRVVYKILRGLGRMRVDDPTLPVDQRVLMAVAERTLARAGELLAYRVAWDVARGAAEPGDDLLARLLAEKERRAIERVFRVLQILEPHEDFATMFEALGAEAPALRASGRELVGHVLEGRVRDGLLALTDSLPAPERLREAGRHLGGPLAERALAAWRAATDGDDAARAAALAEVLGRLREDRSVVLSSVARHRLAGRDAAGAPGRRAEGTRAAG